MIDGIAMGLQVQELNKYKEEFCIDQRYAPQIFAVILAQRSKYHKYWRKYLRRKKRKYMHRKYLRQYLRKYWRNAQNTANIGAYICGEKSENIRTANICAIIYGKKSKKNLWLLTLGKVSKKKTFFLGLWPKLWVGGGQKS